MGDRVVERLGEALALLRRRFPRVPAQHQDRCVVQVEVRQEDFIDDADEFFLVLLQLVAVAFDGAGQLIGDRLHDLHRGLLGGGRRRGVLGKGRRGDDDTEGDGSG